MRKLGIVGNYIYNSTYKKMIVSRAFYERKDKEKERVREIVIF